MAVGYRYCGQIIAGFPEKDLIIVIRSNAELGRWRGPRYFINKFIKNVFNGKKKYRKKGLIFKLLQIQR